jgi:hypothetical protein
MRWTVIFDGVTSGLRAGGPIALRFCEWAAHNQQPDKISLHKSYKKSHSFALHEDKYWLF